MMPQQGGNMTPPQGGNMTPPDGWGGAMPDFSGQERLTGATCTYTKEFQLAQTVNSFASVTDYHHDLQKAEGKDYYVCNACGGTFADAEGTQQLTESNNTLGQTKNVWGYALSFFAGAVFSAVIFAVVCVFRKKK